MATLILHCLSWKSNTFYFCYRVCKPTVFQILSHWLRLFLLFHNTTSDLYNATRDGAWEIWQVWHKSWKCPTVQVFVRNIKLAGVPFYSKIINRLWWSSLTINECVADYFPLAARPEMLYSSYTNTPFSIYWTFFCFSCILILLNILETSFMNLTCRAWTILHSDAGARAQTANEQL